MTAITIKIKNSKPDSQIAARLPVNAMKKRFNIMPDFFSKALSRGRGGIAATARSQAGCG
jgi:hypothetical protein